MPAPARELVCAHHPGARAELECRPCSAFLCRDCARMHRDGKTFECLRCGGLLLPILATVPVVQRGPVSFAARELDATRPLVERLPRTWAYLGRPSVLMTLGGLAILQWLASFLGAALMLISAGVTAGLFFLIVESTARGATDLDPPDFTDFWSAVIGPLLRMLATVLPLFVAWALAGISLFDALLGGPGEWLGLLGPAVALVLLWFFLWPLLILVAAISRSVVATVDPRVWFRVLSEMKGDYLVGAAVFYAALLIEVFLVSPLVWRAASVVSIPVVTGVAARFVVLVCTAWRARILGEAARPYVDS